MRGIFMNKKVFRPFWSYDVQKTEEWLSSMAESGYFLIKMNRVTRVFFFQQGEPKKMIYRIAYDKIQSESLSRSLTDAGWLKVLQSGKWFVTRNEMPIDQIKGFPVREGTIKHNRINMYIFSGIFIYLTIIVLMNLMLGMVTVFQDGSIEVVESPLWIVTYIFMGIGIVIWVLSLYSIIKITKTNKKMLFENSNQYKLHSMVPEERRLSKDEVKELKRSGKLIRKRKLGWMYAPDKLEKWLEKMEADGYNLYRVSKTGTVFYFTVGHPRKVSYCADYQNIADESYFNIHRDAGWRNVFISMGSFQKWSIWSIEYSEGEQRPQIYSDKSDQLKHAKRIAVDLFNYFHSISHYLSF